MFPGTGAAASGLTLSKVIGGFSKTLNVANQVIPLYQQAKPLFSNVKGAMKFLKAFNGSSTDKNASTSTDTKTTDLAIEPETTNKQLIEPNKTTEVASNNPTFFL